MKKISRRARPNTITLYNYVSTTSGVATYQRTQIERVFLDRAYQQRLAQRGVSTSDTAFLVVDLSDVSVTGDRTYVAPENWLALTAEDRAKRFTFRNTDDFFIEGYPAETLPSTTKAEMQKKYRCYAISTLSVPGAAGARILEVTAK